ncbi:MAG: translation initiation factor IF-2 associated domain-containing protein, partial [Burkholderiales bacterium]|nr:translation initiation factor IF-2 associated domain-containing protein [Burkholderiales bacterium]
MAVTTVAQFAAELNRPTGTLLEQLQSAGVAKKSPDDALTESDKERLLDYLRTSHGTGGGDRKKITLTRKSTSEIKQADASGKARTIQVEVRKKRVFVKRDEAPVAAEAPGPSAEEEAELQRREAAALAQAEALRQQEEQAARQREEEQRRAREAAEAAAAAKAAAEAAAREAAAALAAAAAPATDAPPAPAPAPVAEPVKPAIRIVKAADADAAEKQRASDLDKRRKAAESEAAAIRAMMNAPKKVLTAKKPEEAKPAAAAKEGISGTIHKPKGPAGAAAPGSTAAKPGDKKSVKSEKLSSSWADDAAKKRGLKTRGDTTP